jgi:hypothetical protein
MLICESLKGYDIVSLHCIQCFLSVFEVLVVTIILWVLLRNLS